MGDPSHYYRGVAQYFFSHTDSRHAYLVHQKDEHYADAPGPRFRVFKCGNETAIDEIDGKTGCKPIDKIALTADFYKGDRSMRESGFDVTFRFGPFGAETHHFAPVCLNSLLYKTETDLEHMSNLLGHPEQARAWKVKAAERQQRMNKYLWDEGRG